MRRLSCLGLAALLLCACQETGFDRFANGDPLDRELGLKRQDYREIFSEGSKEADDYGHYTGSNRIPEMASVLAAPRPPKVGETKLVSIAVTDDVPLKDVLIELSKLADVDLEMDASIEGGIAFRAKDRPFGEVIAHIADLAGLRYKYADGVLRVERDMPFIQNYPIDFLNVVRSSTSNNSITTDVLSISNSAAGSGGSGGAGATGGSGGSGGGINTGSTTTIDSKAQDDFWESLDANIRAILTYNKPRHLSGVAVEELKPEAVSGAGSSVKQLDKNMFYVINRQAGVLSVAASQTQHDGIKRYLDFLKRSATAQVLIEAKVVEVDLDDAFQSGINWNLLQKRVGASDWSVSSTFGSDIDKSNLVRLALTPTDPNASLDAVLNLTERFGTTRTLSSPRLHAINNQPAVLTFAENRVFFEVQLNQQPDTIDAAGQTQKGQLSIQTNRRSIPIGIILNILPSVNLDSNEVTLSVRPTLTRQVGSVVDPGAAFANEILIKDPTQRFVNTVPIVEVRELDSIMRLRSGQVMVIGGLMEQAANNTDNGVPFLSGVPYLGNLFKGTDKKITNRELVIFIRATIVSPQGSYHNADKKLYDKFTSDPRPIAF